MINPMNLTSKHVVVTGASAGIGRATAVQASKLGARVSLIARNEDRLKETLGLLDGKGHQYFVFDLNDINGIEALIKNVVLQGGALDGFVHCAGIGQNRPIKLTKPSFVEEITRIHYFAFAELLRCAAARNCANDGASFVGVSSVAASHGGKTQGAYAAAKSAMTAIVHPYSKELAPRGIRVNTISFGMVETNMYKDFLETGGNDDELLREQYLGVIPVEYAGNAICFLLSDAAKYISGGSLNYDAGVLS